jgi:hypothetical protein
MNSKKRDSQILLVLSSTEKEGFRQAAELAGIGVSAWARERLRSIAIRELQQAGRKIPFIKPVPLKDQDNEGH